MAAAAHSPAFARKVGVPRSVAKEFNQADKGTGMIRPRKSKMHPADSRRDLGTNFDAAITGGGDGQG